MSRDASSAMPSPVISPNRVGRSWTSCLQREAVESEGSRVCRTARRCFAAPAAPLAMCPRSRAAKTSVAQLTTYLMDPLKGDPSGRMPRLPLRPEEARDLALYLCLSGATAAERDPPPAPDKAARLGAFERFERAADQRARFEKL